MARSGYSEILALLTSGEKLSGVLSSICSWVSRDGDSAAILTPLGDGLAFDVISDSDFPSALAEQMNRGVLIQRALDHGKMLTISRIADDPNIVDWRDAALAHEFNTCRALPFFSESGSAMGVMMVYSSELYELSEGHVQILDDAIHLATLASRDHQLHKDHHESQAQLQSLLNHSQDAIYVHVDMKVVYANPSMIEMFGLQSIEDAIGISSEELLDPSEREVIRDRAMNKVGKGRTTDYRETRLLHADGTTFHGETRGSPILWKGAPAALVIARNVTDKKRAQENSRKAKPASRALQKMFPAWCTNAY